VAREVREEGFSLAESLIALGILAVVAVSVLPAFMMHVSANTRNEMRSSAVSAAQERLESLRLQNPTGMPVSGSTAPQLVTVDGRQLEVVTHFCERTEYCTDDRSRHIRVEVKVDGRTVYDVETVYTQLL
jgi:type II secretory pathway pseudopilin PulG